MTTLKGHRRRYDGTRQDVRVAPARGKSGTRVTRAQVVQGLGANLAARRCVLQASGLHATRSQLAGLISPDRVSPTRAPESVATLMWNDTFVSLGYTAPPPPDADTAVTVAESYLLPLGGDASPALDLATLGGDISAEPAQITVLPGDLERPDRPRVPGTEVP